MRKLKPSDIEGGAPEGSEYAQLNPSRKFIQKFYKINENGIPMYYGEQGGWHASMSFNACDLTDENNFIKIIS